MAAVYRFIDECEDKMLLGNKGANLVTMARIGLRVPPGFVVSIEAYADYRRTGRLPIEEIEDGLRWLSDGKSFAVEEVKCRAAGDEACVFHIRKDPLN